MSVMAFLWCNPLKIILPMTHYTPVVPLFEKNEIKKNVSGPRAETLMIIRQFARVYEFEPVRKQKVRKVFVN